MTIQDGFLDLLRSIALESAPSIREAFFKGLERDSCSSSRALLARIEETYKKFSENAGLENKPKELSWHRFYYCEVQKIKENIKRMREFEPVPDAVMSIANDDKPILPRERQSVLEYFEARDTITIWRVLAQAINRDILELDPATCFLDLQKMIDLARAFLNWCRDPNIQSVLSEITYLDLRDRHLHKLPSQIITLKRLKGLDLSNNNLKVLPDEIGELVDLRTLILSHNRLNSLPDAMMRLVNLEELSLLSNKKLRIPECIYSLPGLQSIKISTGLEKECVVLRRMRLLNR